jgi:hypothetical protein
VMAEDDGTENDASGSITIEFLSYRTYDGIYASGNGEPIITPIPQGL